jgi:hypothetical protein
MMIKSLSFVSSDRIVSSSAALLLEYNDIPIKSAVACSIDAYLSADCVYYGPWTTVAASAAFFLPVLTSVDVRRPVDTLESVFCFIRFLSF